MKLYTFILLFFISGVCLSCKNSTADVSVTTVDSLVVYKSKRKLLAYSGGEIILNCKISLGKNPIGAKHFQNDLKTPEGIYSIFAKNPKSGYHLNLGISYPNATDLAYAQQNEKPAGGDIKIHGMRNGWGFIGKLHLLLDWTNGCIAVTDKEMDLLYGIVPVGTPISIYR
jgi:murein L,D-transpeptidase YafK